MAFSTQYKKLFQARILHLYFLNKGENEFHVMNKTDKVKQLETYNYQNFMRVQPTFETLQKLNGHQMVFKNHNSGFAVWAKVDDSNEQKPAIDLDDDFSLTFTLKINDPRFFNYTNFSLENMAQLFYFSNKRLPTEIPAFPLISSIGDEVGINESFIISEAGAEVEKTDMLSGEKSNLFGIITIHNKADNSNLNLTTSSGEIPQNPKNFELFFENRKTYWRYIFGTDRTVTGTDDVKVENSDKRVLVTKQKYPLTQRGFIEVKLSETELPNPDPQRINPEVPNEIFSEIYM